MTKEKTEEGSGLPPELANLAAAADASLNAAQELPPAPGQELTPTIDDQGKELADMLKSLVMMAEPMAPYIPKAYDAATCDRIGLAVAAVAEKYQWDMSKLVGPEVMLLFVTVPPTITAVTLAKQYYAWLDQQQNAPRVAPAPAPAAQSDLVIADGG